MPKNSPKKKTAPVPPAEAFAYDDFVGIFEEAAQEQLGSGGGPVEPARQARALRWVAQMKSSGLSIDEPGPTIWLCEASGDLESELTPLAWAVDQGLLMVVEALLGEGADPEFAFQVVNEDGDVIDLSIEVLALGWSATGYRPRDAEGLIRCAIERKALAKAASAGAIPTGKSSASSRTPPKAL